MGKISIYLDDLRIEQIDSLIAANSSLNNRSALISHLIEQEAIRQEKVKMVKAAKLIDELDLGWTEEEERCAIIDSELSG